MKSTVFIGTSGYSYSDWVGPVYPLGTDRSRFLELYAEQFSAVELNFSYYRQPEAGLLERMAQRTPENFGFSVKAHKSLTHIVGESWPADAKRFLDGIKPLSERGRLIAILLQFPFSFHYSKANRTYLAHLCDALVGMPLAAEFRNGEWHTNRVIEALSQRNIAYTLTDYPDLDGLPKVRVEATSDVGYLRFHGRNKENWWTGDNASRYDYLYSDEEIEEWIDRIRVITRKTKVLIAVFNNHWRGQAVQNSVMLKKKLEVISDLELPDPRRS
jgi:uncharacterized protein YecE (DUF72 family)